METRQGLVEVSEHGGRFTPAHSRNRIYLAESDSTYEAVPHRCMGVGDQTGWYLFSWLCHFQVTWGMQLRIQGPHQQKESNSTKPMGLSKIEVIKAYKSI